MILLVLTILPYTYKKLLSYLLQQQKITFWKIGREEEKDCNKVWKIKDDSHQDPLIPEHK